MKRAIIIRYGGFGDVLQAASILPGLKSQGWNITWDTSENGFELLKSDPLVDALLLSPTKSVPPEKLGEYWNARTNGFDRVINLCESVENSSLMQPTTIGFFHDDETRRRLYGSINYIEYIHRLAGVPGPFLPRYCPENAELDAARAVFARNTPKNDGFVRKSSNFARNCADSAQKNVVLALSGSAEYKVWPYSPEFVVAALKLPATRIFLSGGPRDAEIAEKILDFVRSECERDLHRVVDLTARPVRENYAIAWLADCVVGPETGLLNAVASTPRRKVVLLSHSSPKNLTEHWINTSAIEPSVSCHPCHRLHASTKFCPRGPSGQFAACTESIDPMHVVACCQINSEAS